MNALSKKLLSWLCVAAMVFAMVPAVALPAAAETEAAPEQQEEIVYGSANLPEGTQEIVEAAKAIQNADLAAHIAAGTCPICGTVEGGWQEATYPKESKVENNKRHYYVYDSTEITKAYNWYAANAKDNTMCLALLNTTPKEIGGMIGLRNSASGCTLNIMGSGTITSDGTKTNDGQFGVICVQGSNNTVNLYGGTFVYTGDGQGRTKVVTDNGDGTSTTTYTPSGNINAGTITLKGSANGNVVNMFDGVAIGPEEQDTSKPCFNVVMMLNKEKLSNTFNMYGGTIRNGVSNLSNVSGNVHMHYDKAYGSTKPTFNMYGGTVTGGTYVEGTSKANGGNFYCGPGAQVSMYGGTVTGGKALSYGGNFYIVDSGVTRATFAGGIIENGQGKSGGNIYSAAKVTVKDTALLRGGNAFDNFGGNIYMAQGSAVRPLIMEGGKLTEGQATKGGGNVYADSEKASVTISGGILEKGNAAHGGNLAVAGSAFTMTGGTIQDGIATASSGGGNIFASGASVVNITGGTVQNGTSSNADGGGGNLRVNCTSVTIGGNAQILGGSAGFQGGSIYSTSGCAVTINGDAVVSGGVTNSKGGNVALYNGTLTIGGNAQIKDGKATRYTTKLNDAGKEIESYVGEGGNIYVYPYSTTVDGVKTYSNELRIQDNAVISGGWAVRGGNIAVETSAVAEIESGVTIRDGIAGLLVDNEMVLDDGISSAGRGGNVYVGVGTVSIAATLSGGKAVYGGNLGQYGGTVNFSGIMENGYASYFGGNVCVQGTSAVLNLEGAELRNAISDGQGGNIRAYCSTINMNGGKIYGGDDLSKNNTDNVWLVRATLNMSGDATITGNTIAGSAVRLVAYDGYPSVVTLADTASVIGEGSEVMNIQKNDLGQSILYVTESWTGVANVGTSQGYTYGDKFPNEVIVVGSFAEDGAFTKGGTFSGQLRKSGIDVYGVEGNAVMAAAGIVAADGSISSYPTNEEALAAYTYDANGYVVLTGETAQIPETVEMLNLRLVGKDVTLSGKATVYGSDWSNDDYEGNTDLTIAEGAEITVKPVANMVKNRYIATNEGNVWNFHRLTMYLDTVTLRTEGEPGLYYKAIYKCDEALKGMVDSYGVVLSLANMPGADFETEADINKYTAYGAESFQAAYGENHTVNTISGAVVGILKEKNSKETNTANANREIYANAYLNLTVNGETLQILADTNNAGKTTADETFTGTAYSMVEVLEQVNAGWDSYSEEDKATVQGFLMKWAAFITDEAVGILQTKLDKIFQA